MMGIKFVGLLAFALVLSTVSSFSVKSRHLQLHSKLRLRTSTVIRHLVEEDEDSIQLEVSTDEVAMIEDSQEASEERPSDFDPISIILLGGIFTLFADDIFHFMPEGGVIGAIAGVGDASSGSN
mmetsp:Transcript_30768/g.61608  ORF Transcript_30768/g.61608 Transcript_30768/m.61608 type:complete len:124 (-) Transcript_30768:259-630(-)